MTKVRKRRKPRPLPSPEVFDRNCRISLATLTLIEHTHLVSGIPVLKLILEVKRLVKRMRKRGPEALNEQGNAPLMESLRTEKPSDKESEEVRLFEEGYYGCRPGS